MTSKEITKINVELLNFIVDEDFDFDMIKAIEFSKGYPEIFEDLVTIRKRELALYRKENDVANKLVGEGFVFKRPADVGSDAKVAFVEPDIVVLIEPDKEPRLFRNNVEEKFYSIRVPEGAVFETVGKDAIKT